MMITDVPHDVDSTTNRLPQALPHHIANRKQPTKPWLHRELCEEEGLRAETSRALLLESMLVAQQPQWTPWLLCRKVITCTHNYPDKALRAACLYVACMSPHRLKHQ